MKRGGREIGGERGRDGERESGEERERGSGEGRVIHFYAVEPFLKVHLQLMRAPPFYRT